MGELYVDTDVIVRVSYLYGVTRADPRYDYRFDVDQDGEIGARDLVYFHYNYGKTVKVPQAPPTPTPTPAPQVYGYVWDWEGYTQKSYDTQTTGVTDPFNFAEVVATAKYTTITAATEAFVKKFAEKGIAVTVSTITPEIRIDVTREMTPTVRGMMVITFHHKLSVKAHVEFTTTKPLTASPLDPATALLLEEIAKYIILALVAAFLILALKEWLQSMTTQTSNITTKITNPSDQPVTVTTPQGTVTIPAGGTYEYTESTTAPSISGIISLGILAIVGIGGIYVLTRKKEA